MFYVELSYKKVADGSLSFFSPSNTALRILMSQMPKDIETLMQEYSEEILYDKVGTTA